MENLLDITKAFCKWLLFGVGLSLTPIIAHLLLVATKGNEPILANSLRHGELLLITVSLCAAAVGDLIGTSKNLAIPKIVCGGGSMLILVTSAIYFAGVTSNTSQPSEIDAQQLRYYSLILFFAGVVCSGLCVCCSANREPYEY